MPVGKVDDSRVEKDIVQTFYNKILNGLEQQWKLSLNSTKLDFPVATELTLKQKEFFRDVFANVTTKRILFDRDKRSYASRGFSDTVFHHQEVADAVILPMHTDEIQSILTQAQQNDIKLQVAKRCNMYAPFLPSSKKNAYCIISLESMCKILQFRPEEFSITVQTGLKVGDLNCYLNEKGWELSLPILSIVELTVLECLENEQMHESVSQILIQTPSETFRVSKEDSFFHYFLKKQSSVGIISEVTLQIRPLPKHIRRIEAEFNDIQSLQKFLSKIKEEKVSIQSIQVMGLSAHQMVHHFFEIVKSVPSKDIFESIFKKNEEKTSLEKHDDFSLGIVVELYEYQHNISSTSLRVKDVLQEMGAKINSFQFLNLMEDWRKVSFLLREKLQSDIFDFLSMSHPISTQSVGNVLSELRKKLERAHFYAAHKSAYQIHLKQIHLQDIEVEVLFVASRKHRKNETSHIQMYQLVQNILKAGRKASPNLELSQLLKKQLDPKNVMVEKMDVTHQIV